MSIEAMKQALEALDDAANVLSSRMFPDAAAALRAAIEQAEKPVAWRWKALVNGEFVSNWVLTHSEPPPYATESMPLYTAPRQWVGLTDEDKAALDEQYGNDTLAHLDAIEAKLKEKNT
jgi:hypothetical protein